MINQSIQMKERRKKDLKEEDLIRIILKMSITAILASLGIILSSVVVLIPNFEFISLTIFLISLLFGSYYGTAAAIAIALIYEFLVTPIYGASGLLIPFKLLCYLCLAVVVGLSRSRLVKLSFWELGIIGSLFALIYDSITTFGGLVVIGITNIQQNLPSEISLTVFITLMIVGIPMTIIHVISNFVLFGLSKTMINWIISAFKYRGVRMLMIESFMDLSRHELNDETRGDNH